METSLTIINFLYQRRINFYGKTFQKIQKFIKVVTNTLIAKL